MIRLGLLFICLTLAGCKSRTSPQAESSLEAVGKRQGQLRGYLEIEEHFRQRLIAPEEAKSFTLDFMVDSYSGTSNDERLIGGNLRFLGIVVGDGFKRHYENIDPNAINMMLWYSGVNNLVRAVIGNCRDSIKPSPGDSFSSSTSYGYSYLPQMNKNLCEHLARIYHLTTPPSDDALLKLWEMLMPYDVPEAEYIAWANFVKSEPNLIQATRYNYLHAMLVSMLFNPYFLLEP